jgi:ribosomal protein L7/L12
MTQKLDCPNCGAPLDDIRLGVPTTICKFCRTNVLLPTELSKQGINMGSNAQLGDILGHAQDLKRMVELARSGKQIEAIRIFREIFDTSLAESKRAIDAIAAGQPVIMPAESKLVESPTSRTDVLEQIINLHRNGSPLEAIKLFKETYGSGLDESRELVERLAAGDLVTLPDGTAFQMTQGFTDLTINPSLSSSAGTTRPKSGIGIIAAAGMAIGLLAVITVITFGLIQEKEPEVLTAVFSTETPTPTATVVPYASPVLTFGGQGTGPGLFTDAREIGVDQDGNIYIGDFETEIVQVFGEDGAFISQWFTGKRDDGNVLYLRGMAVSLDGRVFIPSMDGIYEFDGMSGERLGELTYPAEGYFEDIAAASDGSLVSVFFYTGENIVRFDKTGAADLFIESPIGNVTDHSELDTTVAVDGLGNIYLLGSFNNLAFIYNRDGKYQNKFGGDGEGAGTFQAVDDIAVDNQSRIYISDINGIQVFDQNGRYLDAFTATNGVRAMVFDMAGNLYTVDYSQQVTRYQINQ